MDWVVSVRSLNRGGEVVCGSIGVDIVMVG